VSGVHQFVPMLHEGDAVGRHTMKLRELLTARGITSRIYVDLTDPKTASETTPATAYLAHAEPGDILLYQFATASDLAPWLASRGETLVVNYHNVTPPEYYAPWDNGLARHQLRAQQELRALAARTTLAVGVSVHNEAELRQAGFRSTSVVPPAAMLPVLDAGAPRAAPRAAPRQHGARWLSVGRLAPNKALQHALMALLVTRAHHDPEATLQIVGHRVVPSYTRALHRYVADLGLRDVVTLDGHLSDPELADAFAAADVLVMTSAHEGFGIPVIEAMHTGLPVVANRAGALPEVVGDAGVLVDTADPYALSWAVARLLADPSRCAALAEAGRRRLNALDLAGAGDRLIDQVIALR
jgi:glycosyltransferase involved in cell wall biosynthesis